MLKLLQSAIADLRQPPAGTVPSLDVLRSAAILLVFSNHVDRVLISDRWISELPFVNWGWTGVDLFFVLSGFLIGGQLWKEVKRSKTIDVGQFVMRRGFRIWPLYFAVIMVIVINHLIKGNSFANLQYDVLFLSNYIEPTHVPGGWSLATEEQFYVALPIILLIGSRFVSVERMIWVPIGWLVLLPIFRVMMLGSLAVGDNPEVTPIYKPFHTHSDALGAGLIISWISVARPEWMKSRPITNVTVLAAACATGLFLRMFVHKEYFSFTTLALVYGGLMFYLLRMPSTPRPLQWKGFYVVSRLSYGIYLNHVAVLFLLIPRLKPFIGRGVASYLLCWILCLVLSMITATLSFAYIELPFLRLRERYLKHSGKHATAGA